MTPPAMTTAARSASARQATRARRVAAPRPWGVPYPSVPRRVSGPARRRPATDPPLPFKLRHSTAEFVRGLPNHRLIDRLVRGRAWIPVLGVLLAGVVATQVEVLKLGASMGRWMERDAALSSRNQALQASVAALSDDQRIERLAAQMGMVMPAPTAITFLSARPAGGPRSALARIHPPDSSQFLALLQTLTVTTPTPVPVTPPPATVSASTGVPASTAAASTAAAPTASAATTAPTTTTSSTPAPTGASATATTTTTANGAAAVPPATPTTSQTTGG